MPEIIPNWHPIFVHFTIALLGISVALFIISLIIPRTHACYTSCITVARWNLWMGALITVGTLCMGWIAYNSVAHDAPSHAAMTDHKNWAFVASGLFIILALWAFIQRSVKSPSILFIAAMLVSGGVLATTGFKGGEAVYRFGLGVMSLPQSTGDGHNHSHGGEGNSKSDHDEQSSDGGNKAEAESGDGHGEH